MGTLGRELINDFEFVQWWLKRKNKISEKKRGWHGKENFSHQTAQSHLRNFLKDEDLLTEYNLFKKGKPK